VVSTTARAQSQDVTTERGAACRHTTAPDCQPLNEVLAYVDVMDQVADDFVRRLRQVRHQLDDHEDSSTTLEHELLQFGIECTFSFVSLTQKRDAQTSCICILFDSKTKTANFGLDHRCRF